MLHFTYHAAKCKWIMTMFTSYLCRNWPNYIPYRTNVSTIHLVHINVNNPLSSLGPIFILLSPNLLFYLRLLCFSDFILVQGDIFGRAGISSVLPLRSIFCQKCHQRLFRQSSRHGFQQRLFQKRRPAYLGRARPCHAMQCCPVLLHYVLSCVLCYSCC